MDTFSKAVDPNDNDCTKSSSPNTNLTSCLPPQGMSRARDILHFLPFSRTTLHEWSQDGRFPKSVKLSPTMVAWRNSEVLEWLNNQTNNTSPPLKN